MERHSWVPQPPEIASPMGGGRGPSWELPRDSSQDHREGGTLGLETGGTAQG